MVGVPIGIYLVSGTFGRPLEPRALARVSALGLAAGGATYYVIRNVKPDYASLGAEIGSVLLVTLMATLTAGVLAGTTPVRLRTPDGQDVAGLAQTVAF